MIFAYAKRGVYQLSMMIGAFGFRCLDSRIILAGKSEIPSLKVGYVAVQAD